jgi:hypothetical protein
MKRRELGWAGFLTGYSKPLKESGILGLFRKIG